MLIEQTTNDNMYLYNISRKKNLGTRRQYTCSVLAFRNYIKMVKLVEEHFSFQFLFALKER